jgi:outer membrane protein assembly factor BamB
MRFLIVALLLIFPPVLLAQDTDTYEWAGLQLQYPAGWDEPLPTEADGRLQLQMAQVLVGNPDVRPPSVPIINLMIYPEGAAGQVDLLPFLVIELQNIGIDTLDNSGTAALLGTSSPEITGTSADGQFFGLARATIVNNRDVLVMVGRAIEAQRTDFALLFDTVAASMQMGMAAGPYYGIAWHTQRSMEDGDDALLNLVGLAAGPPNTLYTYEQDLGVVRLSARTGAVEAITPNENIFEPSAIAAASDGTVYVADPDCGCIFTLTPDGSWLDVVDDETGEIIGGVITGFGLDAPAHLMIGPDDTLYATDITGNDTITVQMVRDGQRQGEIRLAEDVLAQPLLTTDTSGQVIALTQAGELLTINSESITSMGTLDRTADGVIALAFTADNHLALATADQGALIFSLEGDLIAELGSTVSDSPQPGELVSPVGLVAANGRLYVADSDGTFGAITAFDATIPSDRLGAEQLIPGLAVQGLLSEQTPQQTWTYSGTAGERITLTALDNSGAALNLALRLLDPAGTEIAFNDDHSSPELFISTDAQIDNQPLPVDGDYVVMVEQVAGEGSYSLGLTATIDLELSAAHPTNATGELSFAFPVEVYTFNGNAGQVITITLLPTSGDLDPLLRLMAPDGSELVTNDDAEDPDLGLAAQIVDFVLPVDGMYRLDAVRFDGSGSYDLALERAS